MMRSFLLCAASLALLLATTSSAEMTRNHLLPGDNLFTGQSLVEGSSQFIIQEDCNLVLYMFGKPVWASGTPHFGTGCFVTLQSNGNLVIFDKMNKAVWSSRTRGENGNYILILQRDGNLVIYSRPIWATGTNKVGAGVVIAGPARVSGAEQNKVGEMINMLEVEK